MKKLVLSLFVVVTMLASCVDSNLRVGDVNPDGLYQVPDIEYVIVKDVDLTVDTIPVSFESGAEYLGIWNLYLSERKTLSGDLLSSTPVEGSILFTDSYYFTKSNLYGILYDDYGVYSITGNQMVYQLMDVVTHELSSEVIYTLDQDGTELSVMVNVTSPVAPYEYTVTEFFSRPQN